MPFIGAAQFFIALNICSTKRYRTLLLVMLLPNNILYS